MGLTERHWFEDEEPRLTERQLEDMISATNDAYKKGFSDGQCAKFTQYESAPVQKIQLWHWCCGTCKTAVTEGDKFCRECGKKLKWETLI